MKSKIDIIREKSNPQDDFQLVLDCNAKLLDALYRLSFTADKLESPQVDQIVNELKRKPDEITVLLSRIIKVKRDGYSPEDL